MKKILGILTFVVSLGTVSSVDAIPILDQSYDPSSTNTGSSFSSSTIQAQTFTVGLTGLFDGINLKGTGSGATVQIRRQFSGRPSDAAGDILQSVTNFTLAGTGIWSFIDFNFAVTSGDLLAIVVTNGSGGLFGGSPGTYSPGGLWTKTPFFNNNIWYPNGNQSNPIDLAFQTFVDDGSAPVPTPATLLLFGLGLTGLGWSRRKKA